MRASSNEYFGEYLPSIDNDMIALPPHNDSCNGWLLSSSTMIVSNSNIRKPQEIRSATFNAWSTSYEDPPQEAQCQSLAKNWERLSLVEADPGMMEDLFESSDSESSYDDDPSSYYSSSTSSYPPEKEEEVWNRYFHAESEYTPPPPTPPHPHRVYSLFPTTTSHVSQEYNQHPTHKSWPGQPWPERLDSRPNRSNGRARAQTTPSQLNTPSNLSSCTSINHSMPGSYIPASYRHTHPPLPHYNSSTPLVLKSEFETDSDDEDENSPNKMARAIEEMFEKFRSNGGASTKNGSEEKTKRSGGFRRSASEACEAVKGIFSKKSHIPSERRSS
ncbi:hypothetical protein MFRU_005g00770 [Monilinia fructicola]|uniref:Uncharacterized protein n=1 Tax=Monilinia fructicola TaxID=38448 RepID=A0A5M9JSL7_MONFR|nr:hypothetical protein EYC84_002264 [Monilinia fructicola]KAG4033060.1 hypothetical protein MFRU_005g00770 [Monilinia fructicola]